MWRTQKKNLTEVREMLELQKQIERLRELRRLAKQIEAESEQIRSVLIKVVEAAGGRVKIGSYILSLADVSVVPYAKIVAEIGRTHPELAGEIEALAEQFKTVTKRLDITETQN
jgi:hypothetical protein